MTDTKHVSPILSAFARLSQRFKEDRAAFDAYSDELGGILDGMIEIARNRPETAYDLLVQQRVIEEVGAEMALHCLEDLPAPYVAKFGAIINHCARHTIVAIERETGCTIQGYALDASEKS